jgi:hypothetical protein
VLADHVRRDALLLAGAGREEGEGISKEVAETHSGGILVRFRAVRGKSSSARFAERVLDSIDDGGAPERVVIWIERKPGALWAVGRAVNPQHRRGGESRKDDYVFEGYELDDALEAANTCLEDDLRVLENDRRDIKMKPFTRTELLRPLERWFFGRSR